jgi:hypothetical protein
MGIEFPRPLEDRLPLSDGAWIVVRRRLTHGERSDSYESIMIPLPDGTYGANRLKMGMANVTAYLLDWSNTDQPIADLCRDSKDKTALEHVLRNISPESFEEIRNAISAHEMKQWELRAAVKNSQGGATVSSAISPSPVDVAGDLVTSAP